MSHNTGLSQMTYVDSIHMSMPAFAKLGALNSNIISALKTNATYASMMFTNFHYIKSVLGASNGLYNATDHLWWRDTTFLSGYIAEDGTQQKCYWSRGNGWAFVALARVMDVLSTNDAHYAEYLQTFQQMAAAIKPVQRPDGFWNVNLAYANDYPGPESSGRRVWFTAWRGESTTAILTPTPICRPSSRDGTPSPMARCIYTNRHALWRRLPRL